MKLSRARKTKLLALLLALSCCLVVPVTATPPWCVNVLVAYDEEWEVTSYSVYAYNPTTFAYLILGEVSDIFEMEFNVRFRPIDSVFWESDDDPENEDVMMNETIDETGFHSGMTYGYHTLDILVAFTDQKIPNCYGYCDPVLGVVLVREAWLWGVGQATDNVLQHELSHLYLPPASDHDEEGLDCVMNYATTYIGAPWWYKVRIALTTNDWCEDCHEVISANAHAWGRECSGGGSGHLEMVPYGGDETA